MAATYVHEESSAISKQGVSMGLKSGYDILYDTSGDTDPDHLAEKVAGFRSQGAGKVFGDYAFCGSIEEAQARSDARAEQSDGLRRYVPSDVLEANHREVAQCWYASAKSGTFDGLRLWDTSGPMGSTPTLIASAEGGNITVSDQTQYDKFMAIGGITKVATTGEVSGGTALQITLDVGNQTPPESSRITYGPAEYSFRARVEAQWLAYRAAHPDAILDVHE
jgi:hypothetical protein